MNVHGRKYDDIINLPHHVSDRHPHMPVQERAAQFTPFAALIGYDDAIKETARFTEEQHELSEEEKEQINISLSKISQMLQKESKKRERDICITYYMPDKMKSGGKYVNEIGAVKKIDEYNRVIIMKNHRVIPIKDIFSVDF